MTLIKHVQFGAHWKLHA